MQESWIGATEALACLNKAVMVLCALVLVDLLLQLSLM